MSTFTLNVPGPLLKSKSTYVLAVKTIGKAEYAALRARILASPDQQLVEDGHVYTVVVENGAESIRKDTRDERCV